jgi:hypothetical protein
VAATGGGGGHQHTVALNVNYVDLIIAQKNSESESWSRTSASIRSRVGWSRKNWNRRGKIRAALGE